jgi:Protein of unknown function (DUF2934)
MSRPSPKNPASSKNDTVSRDEIAREAFKMFQARHGAPGDPVADWFEAEKIVRARTTAKPARAAQAQAQAQASAGNGGRNNPRRRNTRRRGR